MRRFLSVSSTSTCLKPRFSSLCCFSPPIFHKRNIFIPLTPNDVEDPSNGKECTLYIKGFLAKGEHADHFETWKRGHKILTNTHQWGPVAHGYFWKSGDLPGSLVPYATLMTGAYHLLALKKISLTPQGLALTAAAEAVVIGGKFWYEFKKASDTAKAHGPNLATHIEEISQKYPYVRVIAHSLGCALLLEALKVLPEKSKPNEIHFLAPAIDESLLHHDVAKEHAYLYHCGKDFALQTASTLFYQKKNVVGLAGPTGKWRGLTSVDVSNHFGFFVHTNYRHVLEKFLVDHKKAHSTSSPNLSISENSEKFENPVESDLETEPSPHLWSRESEKEFLSNLENELISLERAGEREGEEKKVVLNHVEKEALSHSNVVNIESEVKGKEKESVIEIVKEREEEREKESEKDKKVDVQAIVEESVQRIGEVLKKEVPELLQIGKAFLQNMKVLLESRKDIADIGKEKK